MEILPQNFGFRVSIITYIRQNEEGFYTIILSFFTMNKYYINYYRKLPFSYRLATVAVPLTLSICAFVCFGLSGYDCSTLQTTIERYCPPQITSSLCLLVVFGFFKISSKDDKSDHSDMYGDNTETGFIEPEVSPFKKVVFAEKPMNDWQTNDDAAMMVFAEDVSDDLKALKMEAEKIESEIIKRKNFSFNSNTLIQKTDYEVITHLMNTVCLEASFLTDKWYSDAKRIVHTCYNNLLTVQLTLARLDEVHRKYPNSKRFITLYMRYIHNVIAPYLNSYIRALDSRDANDLNYVVFGFAIMHQHTSYTMPSFSDFFDTIMMIRSQFPDEFNQVQIFSKK